jgi:hypothetical protein
MISRRFTRVSRRFERLEEYDRHHRASVQEQIRKAALQALCDEDLNVTKAFIERGAPFADPTPEEGATLARYAAAGGAAALRRILQLWERLLNLSQRSWNCSGPDASSFRSGGGSGRLWLGAGPIDGTVISSELSFYIGQIRGP